MLTGFQISSGRVSVGFSIFKHHWDSSLTATGCFGNSNTKENRTKAPVRNNPIRFSSTQMALLSSDPLKN